MNSNNFEQQVHTVQRHWNNIQQRARELPSPSPQFQAEVITELSVALEELRIAVEELHVQNEQLSYARQQAEIARQHYQELFEFAPDGYLVTDERGIIQEANQAAAELLHISKKYLVNKPLDIFVAKTDKTIYDNQWLEISHWLKQNLNNKKHNNTSDNLIKSWEMQLQPRNKENLPVAVSISVSRKSKHEGVRLRWLLQDISESKQAEKKINEQAALLEIATDAIFVHNFQDQIIFWNKAAEKLYGWTKEEATGKNVNLLLSREFWPNLAEIYHDLFKKGQWHGELHQVTKSDQKIIVESRWTVVRDDQNHLQSILIVNTDITQTKQLEAQRLQKERLEIIGSLASEISHDLNNILAPILGMAQLLLRKFSDADSSTKQMIKTIEINAQRGASLLKQTLMFSRGFTSTHSLLLPCSVISEIKQIAQETFPTSISIHYDFPSNLWGIKVDITHFHQILLNLCLNARDAMPHGGKLNLAAKNIVIEEYNQDIKPETQVGSYVVITVSDTGIGIPLEIREQIFEPFFTSKETGKGTGLGLSIVSNIVKNHRGFIKVSSEVGKGTEFQIFLPAIETTTEISSNGSYLPAGKNGLVLIVDDEVDIGLTTKALLTTYGYQVLTATNGIEALALYAEHSENIAAVLIDLVMPSIDGPTTIHNLHKINPQIKIIATSGLTSTETFSDTLYQNVKAFLWKPYSSQELLTTLQKVIELSTPP